MTGEDGMMNRSQVLGQDRLEYKNRIYTKEKYSAHQTVLLSGLEA